MKGYKAEEIVGRHFSIFYPPEDVAAGKPDRELEIAAETGRFADESWRVRKDGSKIWANVVITALRDRRGTLRGFAKVTRDMTHRKLEEDRFRMVVEAAPNAMVIVGRAGKITFLNSQAERLFLYPREELLGQNVEMLVPPRFRAIHPGYVRGFFSAPTARPMGAGRDLYGLRKDGSEVPVEIGLNPVETPEGTFVLASIIDITERKKSEERFRLVVESSPNAIVIVGQDGKITFVNSQAERLFQYSREELIGKTIETLVPMRFRANHPGYVRGFLSAPSARPMGAGRDLYGLRKDGTEVPVEIGLNPIETPEGTLVLASVIDITERKKSEERFRLVVESSPNAIVIVGQGGKIAFVNSQAERLFRYSREELIGKTIETLVPLRFRAKHPGYRDNFFAAPQARPMGAGRDLYGLRKDGSEVPVEIGLNPLRTAEGAFVLASIIDITERKSAEEELSRGREELTRRAADLEAVVAKRTEHLQRVIAELETFSYTASHDLRAPLRAIEGYSHFLQKRLGKGIDEESQLLLGRMSSSASRMDRLVQDLLTYSRIGRGEEPMVPVDLDAAVSHIVGTYPGMDKVQLRIKSPLGRVIGQDSLVTQTFSNLIVNAIKFVPESRTPSIDIWTERKGSRLAIFVQDNGIGIAREYHEKIFNPFVRLEPAGKYEGTGIGLAIVKKAVERMGGKVTLESRVGKGSTFVIELEAAP